MTFWLAAGALVIVAVLGAAVVLLRRGSTAAVTEPDRAHDVQVYRDQLREVERDRARGVISGQEAARMRAEVARRLLDADRKAAAATAGRAPDHGAAPPAARWGAIAVLAATVGVTFWVYASIGAPGYPDMPLSQRIADAEQTRAERPPQSEMERADAPLADSPADPEHAALVGQLREALQTRPDDEEGHRLLARNEAALGNFAAAYRALERAIELRGEGASADDYAALADLMITAAGGYVSPEAEEALEAALRRDPANGMARYYSGMMYAQIGRPDRAFRLWRALLEQSQPDAPWVGPLRAQLPDMARAAGVRYDLPPEGAQPLRGPSAADVAAAEELSPAQRIEMARSMVERLAERLQSEGGPARDWARLVTAYGEVGDSGNARAVWEAAQEAFAERPDDLETVRRAAMRAGVFP